MNLYRMLLQREADDEPLRVGLIGAGKFGSMFLSQVPLVNERVSVILQNSDRRYQDAYYVQGAYSSPMTFPFENAQAANKDTSLGYRIKQNLALKIITDN
ncbi:MAG: hypothetical protein FGM36_13225 [Burkholderiaceae bacterium]|nr:hypothetical protein [Burkholderiaceae bacterium]